MIFWVFLLVVQLKSSKLFVSFQISDELHFSFFSYLRLFLATQRHSFSSMFSSSTVLGVFLQIHASIASNLSFSYFLVDHNLQPYNLILQVYDLMKFFLGLMLKFLFINRDLFFSNASFAKAILLNSFVDLLSSVNKLPRQRTILLYLFNWYIPNLDVCCIVLVGFAYKSIFVYQMVDFKTKLCKPPCVPILLPLMFFL